MRRKTDEIWRAACALAELLDGLRREMLIEAETIGGSVGERLRDDAAEVAHAASEIAAAVQKVRTL